MRYSTTICISLMLVMLATATPGVGAGPRAEIVIDAANLSPTEIRSDEPAKGKWWLNRNAADWGASNGTILMTGMPSGKTGKDGLHKVTPADRFVSYKVPAFEVDPKTKGWYRVYVGLFHQGENPEARLLVKLTRQPYPEYVQTPANTKGRTAEVYWRAADLSGQKIRIQQPPAIASVQPSRQPFAPLRPLLRTFPTTFRIRHSWLLHCAACFPTAA